MAGLLHQLVDAEEGWYDAALMQNAEQDNEYKVERYRCNLVRASCHSNDKQGYRMDSPRTICPIAG